MKKTLLLSLVVALAITVNAQTSERKWGIGAGTGAYGTLKNGGIGIIPELYFSRYLNPRFDLMLQGNFGAFNTTVKRDLDLANLLLNVRLKLTDETKKLRPYLYAGPGLLADNGGKVINFDLGLGTKYYFSPKLAAYFSAGYLNGIQTIRAGKSINENFWKSTAGLEFDFGKAKDSDMDGVSDKKDQCPNTPAGVAVDAKGCPVDSDGDGVPDYQDDCPTVAGLTSLKGCPDKDKDGVADKDDACPDQAGPVSLKGCPDSDGDGVADKDDKCPDTPKGWKVDASGCPVDTDKDGVPDAIDKCPTVAGTKDNNGCPPKEASVEEKEIQKMKTEPVYFDKAKSNYMTGEKSKIDHVVSLLKENTNYKVNIMGYADSRGADTYNMELSKRRIDSVVKTIKSAGINKTRIAKLVPKGESDPKATNDTEEGRALNRRVEFELIK